MRAYLVCVDYWDLLAVTLPYNRRLFTEVVIVTTRQDMDRTLAQDAVYRNGAEVVLTDLFYAGGANFNKWAALEHALDVKGRGGWLCLMDADILWPAKVEVTEETEESVTLGYPELPTKVNKGSLCTPLRRMFDTLEHPIPAERSWFRLPLHRNVNEWAGYSQVFHGADPSLGTPPWHATDWRHAGGADSYFQAKWPRPLKIRPKFEVLHLGAAGVNWCGRVTKYLDGTSQWLELTDRRLSELTYYWRERKKTGSHTHERLPRPSGS